MGVNKVGSRRKAIIPFQRNIKRYIVFNACSIVLQFQYSCNYTIYEFMRNIFDL